MCTLYTTMGNTEHHLLEEFQEKREGTEVPISTNLFGAERKMHLGVVNGGWLQLERCRHNISFYKFGGGK